MENPIVMMGHGDFPFFQFFRVLFSSGFTKWAEWEKANFIIKSWSAHSGNAKYGLLLFFYIFNEELMDGMVYFCCRCHIQQKNINYDIYIIVIHWNQSLVSCEFIYTYVCVLWVRTEACLCSLFYVCWPASNLIIRKMIRLVIVDVTKRFNVILWQ